MLAPGMPCAPGLDADSLRHARPVHPPLAWRDNDRAGRVRRQRAVRHGVGAILSPGRHPLLAEGRGGQQDGLITGWSPPLAALDRRVCTRPATAGAPSCPPVRNFRFVYPSGSSCSPCRATA
jgi:hypothetical protein